jgi:hypothetical protein
MRGKASHGGHDGHGVAEYLLQCLWMLLLSKEDGLGTSFWVLRRFTFTPPPGLRRNDPKPGSKPLVTDLKAPSVTTVASVR